MADAVTVEPVEEIDPFYNDLVIDPSLYNQPGHRIGRYNRHSFPSAR